MKRAALFAVTFAYSLALAWIGGVDFTERGSALALSIVAATAFAGWIAAFPDERLDK